MPLYEYECSQCHRRTEKIQKFSDAELTVCPHCGGPLERTITAPSFQFSGGGWYKDGYGNAKPAAAAGGDSGSKPASDAAPAGGAATGTPAAAAPPSGAVPSAAPAAKPSTSSSGS